MIIKGYYLQCDECGICSEWIEVAAETVAEVPEKTKEWLIIDLQSKPQYGFNPKNYCSKKCVKKAVDKL